MSTLGVCTSAWAQAVAVTASPEAAVTGTTTEEQVLPPTREAIRRRQLLRRSSTYLGPVGGINVVEAGSGAPQSFRIQLATDFFLKNDYLYQDDRTRYVGGALSLSITPIEHLEISAAATTRSLRNRRDMYELEPFSDPSEVLQTIGDPYIDIKSYGSVAPGVTLGGDVQIAFLTRPSENDVDFAGVSATLRGNASLDLREMKANIPLELRANASYVFDNSGKVVEKVESRRLQQLQNAGLTEAGSRDEFRQITLRHERLAYNVNRVDHVSLALGLEAPLELSERVALHPILEWELWVPVNRQDYDCTRAVLPNGNKIPGQDSCLANEGVDTFPQHVTAGFRLFPALPGLNLLAAVDIGVGGTTNFVRELAPTMPYRVMLAASYTVDLKPKPPVTVVKQVEKRVEVPVVAVEGRIRGTVLEQATNTPVPNVRVTFPGRELSPVVSDAEGHFASYAFAPGQVEMELDAEGYRPGTCHSAIGPAGGDTLITCALVSLPRVGSIAGRVLDENGAPVPGAQVQLIGPTVRNPVADGDGRFLEAELEPGAYSAKIEQADFLISVTPTNVEVRRETPLQLTVIHKPKVPLVTVAKAKLTIKGAIFFNTDTAELQSRSETLLTAIADTLLRNPTLKRVEVQGHTDNLGAPERNQELSLQRAEAVRDWLLRAGVEADRLVAQGYGSTKPIAPNLGNVGRAKNRRVEFVILERGEQ
ncbi:MAG TPA: OmpA family protein [Polyangiales bacterium]|nr:OmpA family protein [Polyangiales bacterium]